MDEMDQRLSAAVLLAPAAGLVAALVVTAAAGVGAGAVAAVLALGAWGLLRRVRLAARRLDEVLAPAGTGPARVVDVTTRRLDAA